MELETIEVLNENLVATDKKEQLSGLGGFLIIIGFGLIMGLIVFFLQLIDQFELYSNGTMKLLTDPQNMYYNTKLYALLNFEIVVNIILTILVIGTIYMFFSKKKLFVIFEISLLIGIFLLLLIDTICLNALNYEATSKDITEFISKSVSTVIWIAYLLKSKRVKNTFVN